MTIEVEIRRHKRELRRAMWQAFRNNRAAYISMYILLAISLMSLIAIVYTPHDPYRPSLGNALVPPNPSNPLGTDWLGRDLLSRIMEGGRYTLGLSVISVLLASAIGTVLGLISGFYSGIVGAVIQRTMEVLITLPTLLLAVLLASVLGVGIVSTILAVAIPTVPVYAKLVHSTVLTLRKEAFVEAAKLLGKPNTYIMLKHILPNISSVVIVQTTYYLGFATLIVSALGFLGLGVPRPIPEWGAMVGDARDYIFSYPHVALLPGLFIAVVAICFNLIGDGLREALDPRLRRLL